MGCCLGTTAVNNRPPAKSKLKPTSSQSPPSAFEEETVKEVLSETPIVPKNPPPVIVNHLEILQPDEHKCKISSAAAAVEFTKIPTVESHESVSEISEMYSYSESFSAATTETMADTKKDEIEIDVEDEVTRKVKIKSLPAKRIPRKRPMLSSGEVDRRKEGGTKPLTRRQMAPSPEKKRQSPSRNRRNGQLYRNVGQSGDAGRKEGTARRSRSPAMRGETGQRRKVRERSPGEKSGDVVPVKAVENEGKSTVEMADDGGVLPEVEPEMQASESLENPLVSLECFIFL